MPKSKGFKCWRKERTNRSGSIYRKSRDLGIGKSQAVFIDSPASAFTHTNKWVVKTYKGVQIDEVKSFNNEKEADKFAKLYMKKHDKC